MTSPIEKTAPLNPIRRPLIIWDGGETSFTFGGALMLVEEGLARCKKDGLAGIDFAIVGVPDLRGSNKGEPIVLSSMNETSSPVAQALIGIQGCDRLVLAASNATLKDWVAAKGDIFDIWSGMDQTSSNGYHLGSGIYCAQIHAEGGELPPLTMANELNQWADDLLTHQPGDRPTISVHLKNNPKISGESNANMTAWHDFFIDVGEKAMFFLVGNEDVPPEIAALSNVCRVYDVGGSAARDLAVVTRSDGFMGMASAFCQAAIFNNRPYVVFKNPDHHTKEMEYELLGGKSFPFASPKQELWMQDETVINLSQAFLFIIEEF